MEFGGKCLNISDPKIKALADKFGEISVSEAITKWEAMGNDSLPSEDMIQLLDDYAMDIEAGTDPIEANRKLQKNIRQSKTIDSKTRIATDRAIDTNIEKYKRVLAKLSGSKTPTQESQEYQDLLTQTFVKSDVGMMIGDGDAKMDQFKQKLRNIYEKIMVFKNDYEVEKMLTKIATDENFLGKGKGIDQDIQAGIEKLYEDGVAEVNQQKIELAKRLSSFETDKLVSLIFFFKSNRITPYIKFIWNGSKLDKIAFSNANYEVELSNRANEHMKQFTDDQIMKLIKKQINRIDSKPTFESDAKFLEKLTGITVKEWEIYTRHTAKTKEEAAKRGMPSFTPKDKILEYQILKNFSKNHPDAKSFKDALFKTRGKGLGGRINTLAKNATLPEVMENISSRFANTKFNKKSSSQLSSQVIDRIMDMKNNDYSKGYYKDNEFVQFHKGRSPLFAEIDGHYVKSSDQDYKSEEAGSLSDDDLMRTIDHLMDSKITGRESYLQNTGQFGDKDKMLVVEVPRITDLKTIENKYLELLKKQKFKWTDGKNSVTRTLTETEAKAVIANIKAEASKNFTNRGGMSAEVKALNYAYNFNLVNDFINGKIEQYGKPEVGKDGKTYFKTNPLIEMFKRNGSQASPGMIGSKYVEGGLGEGFNHLVISKIKGDNAFALMDGGRFITRAHSEKVKKSYGSIFNFGTVIKAIVSHTDNNGMRFLDKSCGIVIDELAKEFPNSPYAKLFEFMQKHGIDSVSTEDTTKFTGNVKAIKLLDKNGFIDSDISTEDLLKNHVRFVETENYRVQQDLTNDGKFYESQVPIQRIKNLMHNSNALKVAEMYNRVSKTRIDNIVDNLRKTNIKQWRSYILGELKFSNSEIETIANEENKEAIEFTSLLESLDDIEKHLANGVPFEHPHVSRWLSTFMANTITKQALGRLTNKVLAVEMPYLPNEDFKLKETKVSNGKVYLPTAAVPYNSKLRTPKKVKSKKEALRLINKYPNSYMDMFTRFKPDGSPAGIHEHEIEVLEDGSAVIPGEFFLFTRIPADAPHSHTLARVAYRLPKEMGNVIITDTVSQQMAGADNDGDQRTIEGFFKEKILNKKGNRIARVNIGEDNAKEMANKAFHMEMQEFYSPEFQKQVLTPIDNNQFDPILENLPKEKKHPQDSINAFTDSRKKNNVGLGVVGLSANIQAVYDFLKAHNSFIKLQKTVTTEEDFLPLSFPQLSARNNKLNYYGSLKLSNFSSDNNVKAINGNLLNLALDNVKDPKIERLGFNEVTSKMFLPAMMLKPDGVDEMKHIESVIAFFNTPTAKKYVEKVRESKRLHSKIEPEDVFNILTNDYFGDDFINKERDVDLTQADIESPFSMNILRKLKIMNDMSYDYDKIQSVIRLTEQAPKKWSDLQIAKINLSLVEQNDLKYIDTSNFRKLPYIKSAFETIKASEAFYDRFSFEETKSGFNLKVQIETEWNEAKEKEKIDKLKKKLSNFKKISNSFDIEPIDGGLAIVLKNANSLSKEQKENTINSFKSSLNNFKYNFKVIKNENGYDFVYSGKSVYMQRKQLDVFSAAINTTALLMSRNRTEKFEVWGKSFVDSIKRFKEQKKSHPIIDLLQYNENKNRIELREDLKRAEISDYELEPMKAEFDRLEKSEDEKDKKFLKDFIDYNVFEFGLSSSKESGSYNVLFTDSMHMEIGNDMKKEKDRWQAEFDEKTFYAIQNEILSKNVELSNGDNKKSEKERKIYEPLLNEKVVEEIGEKVIEGDIFTLPGIPVITTNLGGVHGAGLAQAAKSKGLIKQGDGNFKATDKVVQLPVKLKWSDSMAMNNNIELLNKSLSKLVDVAKGNPNNTYLLPLAGLGHGEGSVEQILPLLIKTLQASPNIKLVLPAEGVSLGRQGTVRKDYTRENLPKIKQMLSKAGLYATQQQAPVSQVKSGVSELFESNPELASIGTTQQYSQYLDTIFPDSDMKDILYHGTPGEKFDRFSDDFRNSNKGMNVGIWEDKQQTFRNKAGVWLATKKFFAKVVFAEIQGLYEGKGNTLPVIVNVKSIISKDLDKIEKKDLSNDAIKTTETVHLPDNSGGIDVSDTVYLITKSENTHILGSKQDIEEFKKFVKKTKEIQLSQQQAPVGTSINEFDLADKLTPIEQNFADGTGGRAMQPQFKGKSTMDLIISGDRTRTTRAKTDIQRMTKDYSLSKISDLVGKVIRMTDKTGRQVYTRITKVVPFTQEYQDATWQKEGWVKSVTDKHVGDYPYAIEFKVVDKPTAQPQAPVSQVKSGVSELFESNPELAKIGSKEQYSQYLDTIFPDSQVKDIVYHDGGHGKIKTEGFRKDLIGISDGGVLGNGFYFYFDRTKKYSETRSHTESVLLNVKNVSTKAEILRLANLENGLGQYEKALSKLSGITVDTKIKGTHGKYIGNYADALEKIGIDAVKGKYGTGEEIVVFEPEQIHILGSKQDIEGFKKFVSTQPQAPTTTVNNPAEYTNYHGGAKKYDTYWEQEGKNSGITKHTVYTTGSYDKLDQATKQKLEDRYQAARQWLGRSSLPADTYAGKLVRRDMMQASKADGIFAVSEIVAPGTKGRKGYVNKTNHPIIEGGTGYAVASGIMLNKPVYVFNQDSSYGYETGWYKWDSLQNNFVKTNTPVLTKNYAGIGSSTNETEIGRQAIRDVYEKTFGLKEEKIIDPKSELTSKANKMSFDQLVEYLSNEENLSEGQKDALKDVNLKTLKLTHANFAMLKHIFCTK